jgi:single-stranded DNA-binding protein
MWNRQSRTESYEFQLSTPRTALRGTTQHIQQDWHKVKCYDKERIAWCQARVKEGMWMMVEGTLRYERRHFKDQPDVASEVVKDPQGRPYYRRVVVYPTSIRILEDKEVVDL